MSLIITIIIIALIFFVDPTSQNNLPYQNCKSTFDCGNITGIGYPFWGPTRPVYCGHPQFELNCTGQTAVIRIQEATYYVLEINTKQRNLKVAKTDYVGGLCPSNPANTTLNSTFFRYDSGIQSITLYYGCRDKASSLLSTARATGTVTTTVYSPSYQGQRATSPVTATASMDSPSSYIGQFSCNITNAINGLYVTRNPDNLTSDVRDYVAACNKMVIVLATQSAVQTLENGNLTEEKLVTTLGRGFGMQWTANDSSCSGCVSSGGKCGYNTTTNSFACHCPDSTYPLSCSEIKRKNVEFSLPLAAIAVIAAALVGSFFVSCYLSSRRGRTWVKSMFLLKKTELDEKVETFISNYQSLIAKRFSYWDLIKMTNSFANC